MFRLLVLFTHLLAGIAKEGPGCYFFDRYIKNFDKSYRDADEYEERRAIFRQNLAVIAQHNKQAKYGYKLGVNQFTDMLPSEIHMGYVKTYHADNDFAAGRRLLTETDLESIITTKPVSELPKELDWRSKGISTPVKNQYEYCGSCWAFATTSAIESHVALATGKLFSLSEQELVSCAPNPLHCGGTGGCDGSTPEIALEYVRTHGIVDEWAFGYASRNGTTVPCTLEKRSLAARSLLRGQNGDTKIKYLDGAVVGIDGWATLQRNNYTAVMNMIQTGPLIVTVACIPWISYKSGVYSGSLKTINETNLDHLVVLEGYGTDTGTGEDYWLIKNSCGPRWGESGYIRLKRVDPATLDDSDADCGIDVTPANGVACAADEDGNPIDPPVERICGTSGILYDVSIPLGAYLL